MLALDGIEQDRELGGGNAHGDKNGAPEALALALGLESARTRAQSCIDADVRTEADHMRVLLKLCATFARVARWPLTQWKNELLMAC